MRVQGDFVEVSILPLVLDFVEKFVHHVFLVIVVS